MIASPITGTMVQETTLPFVFVVTLPWIAEMTRPLPVREIPVKVPGPSFTLIFGLRLSVVVPVRPVSTLNQLTVSGAALLSIAGPVPSEV